MYFHMLYHFASFCHVVFSIFACPAKNGLNIFECFLSAWKFPIEGRSAIAEADSVLTPVMCLDV